MTPVPPPPKSWYTNPQAGYGPPPPYGEPPRAPDGRYVSQPYAPDPLLARPGAYMVPMGQQQVTYRKMGWVAGAFHITMCVMTFGMWLPIYFWARRGRKTVTRVQ